MNTASNSPAPASRRSPWPYMIVGYFILFTAAMVTWVVFALRQDVDLVGADYYEQEIRHQQRIDSVARTQSLRHEVRADYDSARQAIEITLPAAHVAQKPQGRIHLYRPSDARLDQDIVLSLDDRGRQTLDTRSLRGGLWKIKVTWNVSGQEYYYDQSVVVTGG